MTTAHHVASDPTRRRWPKTTHVLSGVAIGMFALSVDRCCYLGARHAWHLPEAVAELVAPTAALAILISATCQPSAMPVFRRVAVRAGSRRAVLTVPGDVAWHGLRLAATLVLVWACAGGSGWAHRSPVHALPILGMLAWSEALVLYRRNARSRAERRARRVGQAMYEDY